MRMSVQQLSVALAMIGMMTGCASGKEESVAASGDTASMAGGAALTQSRTESRLPVGVSARIGLSKAIVPTGEPVTVRLVLHNGGPRDEQLSMGSPAQRLDIVVVDSAEREVWSRLHHEDINLVQIMVPLRTGDSLAFSEQWDQRDNDGRAVPPGSYTVRGYLSPRTPRDREVASARLRVCTPSERC